MRSYLIFFAFLAACGTPPAPEPGRTGTSEHTQTRTEPRPVGPSKRPRPATVGSVGTIDRREAEAWIERNRERLELRDGKWQTPKPRPRAPMEKRARVF